MTEAIAALEHSIRLPGEEEAENGAPPATANTSANESPPAWAQVQLTPEQKMEGRRALCDAVREVWPDVEAGTQGKDKFPLILAIQSFSLEGADNAIADAAVRTAFAEYLRYEWNESACPKSAHQQATGEPDEPLPKDAINIALVKTDRGGTRIRINKPCGTDPVGAPLNGARMRASLTE